MKIKAIILDGFHKGHMVRMEYMPTVKLLQPRTVSVDYCCDGDMMVQNPTPDYIEYKECLRAVDQKVVFYSLNGKSEDFIESFEKQFITNPWNELDTLYVGYHNEPIRRKANGEQMSEYERGFERGVEEGRIIEARTRNNLLKT